MTDIMSPGFGRRTFLKTGLVAGSAVLFSPAILRAQGVRLRKNMLSPDAAGDLASYAKAVEAMLKLPPEDPRNWYRIGFIHLLDCPHGNWWFTSWHRGYLGYFEETIREMSGNPDFMLPYWDWTATPQVPDAMFGANNPLDPVQFAGYVPSVKDFDTQFHGVMEGLWNSFSPAQMDEQTKRMNPSFDIFWNDPNNGAIAAFQDRNAARFLSPGNPHLNPAASNAVALATIRQALAPAIFAQATGVAFENSVAPSHQDVAKFSALSNTHNLVHMSVGGSYIPATGGYDAPYGLMSQNLSSCDPIFFLHHCNIDRLWDVWTRRQQAAGQPTAPEGDLLDPYKREPYLFYVNGKGDPVTDKTTAWDYFERSAFDYSYAPGSGEEVVTAPVLVAATQMLVTARTAEGARMGTLAAAVESPGMLRAEVEKPDTAAVQIAEVSFQPPHDAFGKVFSLFIAPAGDATPEDREFAGSFTFFGHVGHADVTTFSTPVSEALDKLAAKGMLGDKAQLSFSLETSGVDPAAGDQSEGGKLLSVDIVGLSTQ